MGDRFTIQNPGRCPAVHRDEIDVRVLLKEGPQLIGNNGFRVDRGIEAPAALRRLTHIPERYAVLT